MSAGEAAGLLKTVNDASELEVREGALIVHLGAVVFPERLEGQLALAQRYARADEMVQGRKRSISFLDPGGRLFATADPARGVELTR
jgi:hypothetical protein